MARRLGSDEKIGGKAVVLLELELNTTGLHPIPGLEIIACHLARGIIAVGYAGRSLQAVGCFAPS
jgi:hypothetical protein